MNTTKPFLLELASSTWDQDEINAIKCVIDSGHFTMADNVSRFEKEFSKAVGANYAVMVNSGSSANLLMVAALFYRKNEPLKSGDEVVVPAVSWGTTYFPLVQYGLRLKFVDINLNTLNYDIEELRKAVTDKTRMIMAVNLLGNNNEFSEIKKLITGRNIVLVEDNCESLGATYQGKSAGTFGLMGTYSTFFSHHISTMEGGVVVTDDEEMYHLLLCLRAHGWTRNLPEKNFVTGIKSANAFEESFKFILPGYNLRPTEISGAIGLQQLKKLPTLIEVRRKNASCFAAKINTDIFHVQQEIGESSWFGFSLIVKNLNKIKRSDIISKLDKLRIQYRPIVAGNFTRNEVMKYINAVELKTYKNADYLHENGLFIGNHHYDITEELTIMCNEINNY